MFNSSNWDQTSLVQIPTLPRLGCVNLGELLHFSVPWFPHLENGLTTVPTPSQCCKLDVPRTLGTRVTTKALVLITYREAE